MLEEKCMNKRMSEHQTNELLPPLGIWALWGWRLIFVTHVNTTQSITGSWFLPAVPAIDTQPGDEAWKMEGLSVGRGAFPSLLFTAPTENSPSALGLGKRGRCPACRRCRLTPETRARGAGCVLRGLGSSQVYAAGTVPRKPGRWTLASCSRLLCNTFLSPGSTRVLTSPRWKSADLSSSFFFSFFPSMRLLILVFPRELLSLHTDSRLGCRRLPPQPFRSKTQAA